jgi:hypothetical protein
MITGERLGRLALGSIAAIIASLVLQGICSDPSKAMGVWLLYTIVVACAINSQDGEPALVLAAMAILPAATPLLVLSYPLLFLNEGVCFSGAILTGRAAGFVALFFLFLLLASWVAIVLFAYARNTLVGFFVQITDPKFAAKLKATEAVVKAAVLLAGSVGLLYMAIIGR